MAAIGVKELKAKASLILRSLKEGESKGYVITSRGKPVAKLVPIDAEELDDVILSMDNPKFKEFVKEIRKESTLTWKEAKGGKKKRKVQAKGKKAS